VVRGGKSPLPEPVAYGTFDPNDGAFVVFIQDTGGASSSSFIATIWRMAG
jgi:hypothetical protein